MTLNDTEKCLHDGHRQRVKERFKTTAFNGFQPHEILEFLLFFGIPFKDTNALAHKLIDAFGNYSNVFDAPIEALKNINGMTDNAAVLIKAVPLIAKIYRQEKLLKKINITNFEQCSEFLRNLLFDSTNEEFYLLSLDMNNKLINYTKIAEGTVNRVNVFVRKIQEQALTDHASSVVIAHNHPSHTIAPSVDDLRTTKTIISSLAYIEINVFDHIIISGDSHFSFHGNGVLDELKSGCPQYFLAQFAEANNKWKQPNQL